MTPAALAILLWAFATQQTSAVPGTDDLAAARALYAAGNYEEALSRVPAAPGGPTAGQIDEYRALCLLALGRTDDAQRSLDDLVARQPMFKMSDTDVSPRLVTMFRDARKRLLPNAAREMYAKAKDAYDQHEYSVAAGQFRDLLALLTDDDLAPAASTLADLKTLADGFVTLCDGEAAAAGRPAPPPPASPVKPAVDSPPPSSAALGAPAEPTVYTEDNKNVTPPVALTAEYPTWHPPNKAAERDFHGVLRVVIDATGHVESAVLVVPLTPSYDPLLLAAAKTWTFKPAQLNGVSVKYRKQIAVSLSSR